MEAYFAAAYWGARRETVESCAVRASKFLAALAQISDLLKAWRKQGRSRAKAVRTEVADRLSTDELVQLFMKGQNRRDVDGGVIDDLGYRISMWNGGDEETASSLTMGCGMYSTVAGLSNAVVLNLPKQFDVNSRESVRDMMLAFALAWEPDWAIVSSQSALNLHLGQKPFLDKALYLSSKVPLPDDLNKSTLEQPLENGSFFFAPS